MTSPASNPIIGQSACTQALRQLIKTIAASSSTALVTGESGTGKELVAQALHLQGPRAEGRFVPINCGAIPRELIESELFGHRKGTFTGAVADRVGRFELAHGGTLFLDEIGDLPMDMQVKLLRVLQERCILPVGASREVPVDVRVVAATHRNLEEEVQAGRFREDLYYRINVLPIRTTPLRERPGDLPELLGFYARKHAMPGNKPIGFAPDMLDMLAGYGWPGNVRELSNLVDRFSTLFPGQTLTCQLVPSCMLPSGLVALQTQRLGREQVAPWQIQQPARVEPAVVMAALQADPAAPAGDRLAFDPVLHAMEIASAVHSPEAQLAVPVPKPAASASNDEINAVEEAIFLAQGIQPLPPEGISLKQHLVNIERGLIEEALSRTEGNVSRTAKLLQLQRTTLIEKINKYDLRASS
ncbi:sigma-54 interaction domain-containing protein [Limnohabitans sp.]|uniref:sigma-54 interaction domain-containing protein n=1 Tax=Limnohabitans sp. TaxID=1907725 RepID=UPI0035B20364